MKRLFRLLLLMPLLAACEQDVYDKGDSQYSYLRADMQNQKGCLSRISSGISSPVSAS